MVKNSDIEERSLRKVPYNSKKLWKKQTTLKKHMIYLLHRFCRFKVSLIFSITRYICRKLTDIEADNKWSARILRWGVIPHGFWSYNIFEVCGICTYDANLGVDNTQRRVRSNFRGKYKFFSLRKKSKIIPQNEQYICIHISRPVVLNQFWTMLKLLQSLLFFYRIFRTKLFDRF